MLQRAALAASSQDYRSHAHAPERAAAVLLQVVALESGYLHIINTLDLQVRPAHPGRRPCPAVAHFPLDFSQPLPSLPFQSL